MTNHEENLRVTTRFLNLEDAPPDLLLSHDYWQSIRPENAIGPSWKQFDLIALPSAVLPYSLVIDFDKKTDTYRYRFWGSHLTGIFGADFTAKTIEQIPFMLRAASRQSYGHIVQSKAPQFYQFDVCDSKQTSVFQSALRLPLSDDGENVSHIVSILSVPLSYSEHRKIAARLKLTSSNP